MFETTAITALIDAIDAETAISVAGVAYLLLALIAAVHVLLNKRNEGAAISWLGVIVLSPVFGAIFYGLFGINRMRGRALVKHSDAADRRPASLDPPTHRDKNDSQVADPETFSALSNLTKTGAALHDAPLISGNDVLPLINGDEAYPAMLAAIDQATRSVFLSSYIFQNDASGRLFVKALAAAKDRGVTVRVLIDGVGARYGFWVSRADRALSRLGVKTARFLPASSLMDLRFINLRNHRKVMVVDGEHAFIGGLNIRHGNVLAKARRHKTADVHFSVKGPIVANIAGVFLADWFFATGEVLDLPISRDNTHEASSRRPVRCRVMIDGPDNHYEKLRLTLMAAINAAEARVWIATPYFLPSNALLDCLQLAKLRGVDVKVLLPKRNNLRVVEWAMRANERRWLKAGIELHLSHPPFDHSKFFLIDDQWSLIGSSNWDARSLELNFEINLECIDTELNKTLSALFTTKCQQGEVLTKHRDRSIIARLRNNFFRLFSPYL